MFLLNMPATYYPAAAFGFGLIVGSFLNVCIHRLPLKESVAFPASHCPECRHPLKFYDNIPVFSFLFLGGKCRYCKAPISIRYPLVELLNALLFTMAMVTFGISWSVLLYAYFLAALVVVVFIDLDHLIIPDRITLPGIVIGVLASVFSLTPLTWKQSLSGLFAAGGFLYLTAILSLLILKKEGMGGGDIKLAAMMGAFLGPQKALFAILAGAFLGSFLGIILIILKLKNRKEFIPFGPCLAWGAVVSLFWGQRIIDWYYISFIAR